MAAGGGGAGTASGEQVELTGLLSPDNPCGRTLLDIVARGSSIIAEMQRLSKHIPAPFAEAAKVRDSERGLAEKFAPIVMDFTYFKSQEVRDARILSEHSSLDAEAQQTFSEVLGRFYKLFESMVQYAQQLQQYHRALASGEFIQQTRQDVILDDVGKQLMTEALYLYGVQLLLVDRLIPGYSRERMVVAHHRWSGGEGSLASIEDVRVLTRDTGFVPGRSRPANYPEEYLARFRMDDTVVAMVLARLRSDDLYHRTRVFSDPRQRSSALSRQAAMLYVVLFLAPEVLRGERSDMREVVVKHFPDNWVLPVYMGLIADLSVEWAPYPAAMAALKTDVLSVEAAGQRAQRVAAQLAASQKEITDYLPEGVLTDTFVVDHREELFNCLRRANIALRWTLLHRVTTQPKLAEAVNRHLPPQEVLLDFMLLAAELELKLGGMLKALLDSRQSRWDDTRLNVQSSLSNLAQIFSGEVRLGRVQRSDALAQWCRQLATSVEGLDYSSATVAGRSIVGMIEGFATVERQDVVESNSFARQLLAETKSELRGMVQVVNVQERLLEELSIISDLTYAWDLVPMFVPAMHACIRKDPTSVGRMRALFGKLASVLGQPLTRINQAKSADARSVAEFYSSSLISLLRRVMEIVPVIVFDRLNGIIQLQTTKMRQLPAKIPAAELRQAAQPQERQELAKLTHQISIFTSGVLEQERGLLGVLEVDPRRIFQDGLRKQLVERLVRMLHSRLQFDLSTGRGKDPRRSVEGAFARLQHELDGLKRSFEYIQDFVGVKGLRMWLEEFTRIFGFYTEQEANAYLRKAILPRESQFQDDAIPIPVAIAPPGRGSQGLTFVGRTAHALLSLTSPAHTVFCPASVGWFETTGQEVVGIGMFARVRAAMGEAGLVSLDKILSFKATRLLGALFRTYSTAAEAGARGALAQLHAQATPLTKAAPKLARAYLQLHQSRALRGAVAELLPMVVQLGQLQLLRRQLAHELRFAARLDSSLLFSALSALNEAVVNDVRRHYTDPSKHPYPRADNELLPQLGSFLTASGLVEPLQKIYATTKPQPFASLFLVSLVLSTLDRLEWDHDFGVLVQKRQREALDSYCLLVGVVTVLVQLHPGMTRQFLEFMGQFIRCSAYESAAARGAGKVSPEATKATLFLREWAAVAGLEADDLEAVVPAVVLSGIEADPRKAK